MSFRGGRGGVRGGGGPKGATWEHDATLQLDSKPSELFPARRLPAALPPTALERRQNANYIAFRRQVHNGPLYTKPRKRDPGDRRKLYGEDQDNERYAAKGLADFDPFVGVPTYSMRYEQKQRAIPSLKEQPFHKQYFPAELHDTITGRVAKSSKAKVGRMDMTGMTAEERMNAIQKLTENIDEGGVDDEVLEDDGDVDEDEDDDFAGAEDDMGGDYDAEQYFDNGEDEDGDDGDGGGDDY